MDTYWRGYSEFKGCWDAFAWNEKEAPTPESTGYDDIEGPYDSLADAES